MYYWQVTQNVLEHFWVWRTEVLYNFEGYIEDVALGPKPTDGPLCRHDLLSMSQRKVCGLPLGPAFLSSLVGGYGIDTWSSGHGGYLVTRYMRWQRGLPCPGCSFSHPFIHLWTQFISVIKMWVDPFMCYVFSASLVARETSNMTSAVLTDSERWH
jgi:hypothetical protein